MKVTDLDLPGLLAFVPDGGTIRFAGQRVLLLDAVAMGLLRQYLAQNFGLTAARAVLTQFGFAHGWRLAEALKAEFAWDDDDEWRRAGPRILELAGLFGMPAPDESPIGERGLTIVNSYEAEQHLLHFGRSDVSVCWMLSGVTSGFLSRSHDQELFVYEDRCVGKGDAACHFVARTREDWAVRRPAELGFFEPGRLKDALEVSLQRVTDTLKLAERKLREQKKVISQIAPEVDDPFGIVNKSPEMRRVVDLARRVAKVDATALITGESGSGKERIARLVHDQSSRAAGPFVAVNCGAITETLLESELFGHARGAFTGATHDRPGLFEAANGGTLLLDEVGEVSPALQVKLLRVLQEREVRRVGENKTRKVDVRVVAATNRDLAHGVAGGNFRQDLYYRLKVIELHVPALRERRDDILPLAQVLLGLAAVRMKRRVTTLAPSVADQLLRYGWPGNVRELENAMERAVALAEGTRVELDDLPPDVREAPPKVAVHVGAVRPLEAIEKEYILSALTQNSGNQTRTAEQLDIGTATLYRKLKSYGMIGQKPGDSATP